MGINQNFQWKQYVYNHILRGCKVERGQILRSNKIGVLGLNSVTFINKKQAIRACNSNFFRTQTLTYHSFAAP